MFDSLRQWWICFFSGCKSVGWGIWRILTALFFGFLSLLRWLWRLLVKAVGSHPSAAIIVAVAVFVFIWVFTYAGLKSRIASAEFQRDSASYRASRLEEIYGSDTDSLIIVKKFRNDTLVFVEE